MIRALITINGRSDRERAVKWVMQAKPGTRVEFREAKRSTDQNSKLWASLSDVASQLAWHGQKLTPDDWKLVFLDALKREMRIVPNIDGNGFVNLGRSSSNLSKADFTDLLEIIMAFGAQHGVVFHDHDSAPLQPTELEPA
jgi:hypothetical protein